MFRSRRTRRSDQADTGVFSGLEFEDLDHGTVRTAVRVLREMGRGDLGDDLEAALERVEGSEGEPDGRVEAAGIGLAAKREDPEFQRHDDHGQVGVVW